MLAGNFRQENPHPPTVKCGKGDGPVKEKLDAAKADTEKKCGFTGKQKRKNNTFFEETVDGWDVFDT